MKRAEEASSLKKTEIARLKRYINSKQPENIKKRLEYSKDPVTVKRRKDLNRERRYLCALLIKMLKDGLLTETLSGNRLDFIGNRICITDKKLYYVFDQDKNLQKLPYKDEISLLESDYASPSQTKDKSNFNELLKKFVEGDPEIVSMVCTKKVSHEERDPDERIVQIRQIISKYIEDEDSVNESESESENGNGREI